VGFSDFFPTFVELAGAKATGSTTTAAIFNQV